MEASAASKPLRQENSSPGPQRANQLENNNKQFAPVTLMTQRELPGIRKPAAVRKNEFTHFSRPDAGFRCALCAQRASEAGRPEAMDCVIRVAAGSCLLSKSCRIRRSRVQGGAPLPGGVWGKAPTELFPVKFLFANPKQKWQYQHKKPESLAALRRFLVDPDDYSAASFL